MNTRHDNLKDRTKSFALRIIRLAEALPKGKAADVIGKQLLRSGTSVAANYRAACRAKSTSDFIAKMGIVEEEADESIFWMELLIKSKLLAKDRLFDLAKEADEILSIAVASIKTAQRKKEAFHSALRNPHSALETIAVQKKK